LCWLAELCLHTRKYSHSCTLFAEEFLLALALAALEFRLRLRFRLGLRLGLLVAATAAFFAAAAVFAFIRMSALFAVVPIFAHYVLKCHLESDLPYQYLEACEGFIT
jgi:predicted membrane protein